MPSRWRESVKGYTLVVPDGLYTVFWDTRHSGWKVVHDGDFTDVFGDLDEALDYVDDETDDTHIRDDCVDCPPFQRGNRRTNYRSHPPPPPAAPPPQRRWRATPPPQGQPSLGPPPPPPAPPPPLKGIKRPWTTVLGLNSHPLTIEDAKRQYRALAMIHHPDRGGDADRMAEINTAWEEACLALGQP